MSRRKQGRSVRLPPLAPGSVQHVAGSSSPRWCAWKPAWSSRSPRAASALLAARLLAEHAPDATVVACDLFSEFKSAVDTLEDAVVVADGRVVAQ